MQRFNSETISIGRTAIGPGKPVYVVAEIGSNHNGDVSLAPDMIRAAKDTGADAVKFQNYMTEDFITDRNLTSRTYRKARKPRTPI